MDRLNVLFSLTLVLAASLAQDGGAKYRVNSLGILFYFNGESGFDFRSARALCHRLNGRLPVIHKTADIVFLKELTKTAVWLDGSQLANGSHVWNDGSGKICMISTFTVF